MMSHLVVRNQEDNFRWGRKMDVPTRNDRNYYRSFIYCGVEYLLYDCVYMFREGAKETDIGKIIKIWESKQEKKVRILWFFRPVDIRNFLRDYEPSWNELFLASGEGVGLCSNIPLEAIAGKCSVICTSKDSRNTIPSKSDLGKAEYFFSHTFDVGNLRISEKFPDIIGAVRVDLLFNREKDKLKVSVECMTGLAAGARARAQGKSMEKDCQVGTAEPSLILKDSIVKDEASRTSEDFKQHVSENQPIKKRKIRSMGEVDSGNITQPRVEDPKSILDPLPSYMHQNYGVADKETSQPTKRAAYNKDTRSWFNELSWEKKVKMAEEWETLVCLDNLDPSLTSSEIRDMISKAFKVGADAKIIPAGSFSSPSHGQALVVLNSKDDADFVIRELREKCLMIGERPVVASRKKLGEPDRPCTYPGHLIIDKVKKMKWSEHYKNAVSTSHCSQPNTIQYEMATQWRILQSKSDLWFKALHEEQAIELSSYDNRLKVHRSSEAPAGRSEEASWRRA